MRCIYPQCRRPRVFDDVCIVHMPADTDAPWRSDAPRARVVSVLDRAGYRPEPMRSVPNHPEWGAPDIYMADCPLCSPGEKTMRLEEWNGGTIAWCSAEGRCPSRAGAAREQWVHQYLWGALATRHPEIEDLEAAGRERPRDDRLVSVKVKSPLRGYVWRSR